MALLHLIKKIIALLPWFDYRDGKLWLNYDEGNSCTIGLNEIFLHFIFLPIIIIYLIVVFVVVNLFIWRIILRWGF